IHAAARDGDVELVQGFLQEQAAVDLRDNGGATPLIIAFANGHEACVRVLLDGGADINASHKSKTMALIMAAQNGHAARREGHFDVLQLLLQRGADVHQKDDAGDNALIMACMRGHTTCVAALLDAGADYHASGRNAAGYTALHRASMCGRFDAMELLLKRGADPDATRLD
ncbi:unnamed protein product, partial [Chrysoparadoxa australica]